MGKKIYNQAGQEILAARSVTQRSAMAKLIKDNCGREDIDHPEDLSKLSKQQRVDLRAGMKAKYQQADQASSRREAWYWLDTLDREDYLDHCGDVTGIYQLPQEHKERLTTQAQDGEDFQRQHHVIGWLAHYSGSLGISQKRPRKFRRRRISLESMQDLQAWLLENEEHWKAQGHAWEWLDSVAMIARAVVVMLLDPAYGPDDALTLQSLMQRFAEMLYQIRDDEDGLFEGFGDNRMCWYREVGSAVSAWQQCTGESVGWEGTVQVSYTPILVKHWRKPEANLHLTLQR